MPIDSFSLLTSVPAHYTEVDQERMTIISAAVRGYSQQPHYSFFKHVFSLTMFKRVLILGVYFGRDICFMVDAAKRSGRDISVTGVDKFSDDYCDDWPEQYKNASWEEIGYGVAPSLEAAQENIDKFGFGGSVKLIKQRDDEFLAQCNDKFDLIYIDTAHDYATVRRQLYQALPLLAEGGLMAGDDYSDRGTWGVERALKELAPGHVVHGGWIWMVGRDQILPEASLGAEAMPVESATAALTP